MRYAIKAGIADTRAKTFEFTAQQTMYAGKRIAEGDRIYLFASENEGGCGPATELNFKFYRQATNKIVGISDAAGKFLDRYFRPA